MCGLAGFVEFASSTDESVLRAMVDSLQHRGPDDAGYEFIQVGDARIGLGHRRLAIIDLTSSGHQPMSYRDAVIVYNGEIYNFREIRAELEKLGHQFRSTSDTEVILAGYSEWGIAVVKKFIGMFAFALLDRRLRKLFLLRDRLGVKPLYVRHGTAQVLFGSEVKALIQHPSFERKINSESLSTYLQFGYTIGADSIFQGVERVEPGTYVELDLVSKQSIVVRYWDSATFYGDKRQIQPDEIQEQLQHLLKSAASYRMVADVPVGLFLSGGYDSSVVAALLQQNSNDKLRTFTVGFAEKQFDESPHARSVASFLGTDHTEHYCSIDDALALVEQIPQYFDEPFADYSAIPTMLVSKIARQHVTVALSADGGDELFGGYPKYSQAMSYQRWMARVPQVLSRAAGKSVAGMFECAAAVNRSCAKHRSTANKIVELLDGRSELDFVRTNVRQFDRKSLQMLLPQTPVATSNLFNDQSYFERFDHFDRLLLLDTKVYLPDDLLVKIDRSTMSVSLEGREPLLDHRLFEFMAGIPWEIKIGPKRNELKRTLKKIAHNLMPEALLNRPKMGFSPPIKGWLRGKLRGHVEHYLEAARIARQGLFSPLAVAASVREVLEYDHGKSAKKVWNLLMFQMWHERWMDQNH